MNSSGSGGRLERFFTGKGFYIVLFLCAAVIGVSAWMMAAGNRAMSEERKALSEIGRTESIIIPASVPDAVPVTDYDALLPSFTEPVEEEAVETVEAEAETVETMAAETEPEADPGFLWPVSGDIGRAYHINQLRYDATLGDWRTHDGIDIVAAVGSSVCASRSGRVESIVKDDLYGTVLTLDHGDGTKTVYANLASSVPVRVDEQVSAGSVLGCIGTDAIGESAQEPHLHFALQVNGVSADPLEALNG